MIYALLFFVLLLGLLYVARKSGQDVARLDDETGKNEMAERASVLRDRLKSDPDFAARVRKRFTR